MAQLSLPLTLPELFSKDSFFVSGCNSDAYSTVLIPSNWLGHALYLYGESSSGKSHLANIWRQQNEAAIISATQIIPENIKGNCLVEDIETCSDEESLLHLFNHVRDIKAKLLLTSKLVPIALPFKLPDLTSRLRGCQLATINPPDDILITNVMRKQFSDRQLLVDDEVISYIAARMERSFAGVKEIVEKLDDSALAAQKNITIPFVKKFASL